jgi:hypothetical protein
MKRIQYLGETHRIWSPYIWGDCPIGEIQQGTRSGIFWADDFIDWVGDAGAGAGETQSYLGYGDVGVTITNLVGAETGVVEVAGNDADNDEGSIQLGSATSNCAIISDTAADAHKLWFEARFSKASVADNACSIFVGLAEEGLAAADTLVDNTGAIADKDMIGFNVLQASGEEIDFVYNKDGGSIQTVIDDGGDITAATFMNVGFVYDPTKPTANRIKIVIDNVVQSTYVTGANIAAATFPDGEELSLLWATKVGAAAESKAQLDWWAFAQLYD